jgi:hypothetical protein
MSLGTSIRGLLLLIAPIAAWSAPQSAQAQISGIRPEVHLDLALHGDPGIGARLDIPIVPAGLLDETVDELAISPGIDLLIDKDLWIGLPVALQWNFYVAQKWSVFPELGLALFFGDHPKKNDVGLDLLVAMGGRYHLNARNALVLRLGWPFGLQFGVTF